jgi:hypothetical protein
VASHHEASLDLAAVPPEFSVEDWMEREFFYFFLWEGIQLSITAFLFLPVSP